MAASNFPGGKKPTMPIEKPENTSGEIAYWGDDNLFPQNVLEAAQKNTIIPTTLDWKARALYGSGLVYGKVNGFDDDGNDIFKRERVPEIEDFLRRSNIRKYLIEAATDLYWFYNVFPELILTKDRSKIVFLTIQEAPHCRWAKQDKQGKVKKCFIKGNWSEKPGELSDATTVDVLDPYYDAVQALKKEDYLKFIYPISYPTPDKVYYQLAHWNSVRTSGWLDNANSIASFKKALMENQMTLKYHIEVYTWYWEWKYKGKWSEWTMKQRIEKMDEEFTRWTNTLTGAANAGKAIMTQSLFDEGTRISQPGVSIKPIEDKIKDGIYIEDSQEASSHLLYALGVHPTLVGAGPGKSMDAGSGSDQRVAFNNYISLCEVHRDLILEPLHFIRDYNGWDPEIQFRFRLPMIVTLDKGKEVQQETS